MGNKKGEKKKGDYNKEQIKGKKIEL